MAFYTGRPGTPWNDSLFLGALAARRLIRLTLDGEAIVGEERLLPEINARIRDVRTAADGRLYVLTDESSGDQDGQDYRPQLDLDLDAGVIRLSNQSSGAADESDE